MWIIDLGKIVSDIRHLNYAERCKAFGLTTLVCRLQRGNLIQMYKVVNNIDRINWHNKPILRPRAVRHRGHFVGVIIKNCEILINFLYDLLADGPFPSKRTVLTQPLWPFTFFIQANWRHPMLVLFHIHRASRQMCLSVKAHATDWVNLKCFYLNFNM